MIFSRIFERTVIISLGAVAMWCRQGHKPGFFLGDHNHTYFFTHSELNVYLSMSSACIISDICTICNKVNGSCVQQPNNLQSQCLCNLGFAGNGKYCEQDSDLDGFPDVQLPCQSLDCKIDNCPFIPNSGQENNDADDLGDVCDIDDDNDNITDTMDNCQFKANSNQEDKDGDGLGDICDNCIDVPNLDQKDSDGDGTGDACESRDLDNDGIKNGDNCPLVPNPKQEDTDGDTVGDTCDNCINVYNIDQNDTDQDLIGDACEDMSDVDQDGISDGIDNCKDVPNGDQVRYETPGSFSIWLNCHLWEI